MNPRRIAVPLAGAAAIAVWVLYFAHAGLASALTEDDLMNLYVYAQKPAHTVVFDNLRFWSTAYRPLGAAFYLPLYRIFGLNPLPYRIVCFALLGVNLALLFHLSERLSGSREIAFLAAFLASYHAWFVDLYYSSGTIFELLFYALYMSALLVYVRIRERGLVPDWRQVAGIAALYILALDAKEMAVTLPLMLLAYELLFHRKAFWKATRAVWVVAAITAIYVYGKLTGPDSLVENSRYALTISPVRFLKTFHLYLNPLFYQDHRFHDSNTIQLLLAMLVVAALMRSRVLIFAWLWLLLTTLPIAFIPHYSFFFEYLPMAGWALYAATLLVAVWGWGTRSLPYGRSSVALLFAGIAILLFPLHRRETPKTLAAFQRVQFPSRDVIQGLAEVRQRPRRVLFVDDPFPKDSYLLLFTTRLYYRDLTIDVQRADSGADVSGYDAVFRFQNGRPIASR